MLGDGNTGMQVVLQQQLIIGGWHASTEVRRKVSRFRSSLISPTASPSYEECLVGGGGESRKSRERNSERTGARQLRGSISVKAKGSKE